jgi:hypothetical protein
MSQAATAPVKYAGRTYIIEITLVTALYVAAVWFRPWLIAHAASHEMKLAATVLPALPIWGMFLVVWRYYRRIDEFERQRFLETIAIAFGVGSCLVCTYSFLADAGLPELAITWAWPTLAVSWALTGAIMHVARR